MNEYELDRKRRIDVLVSMLVNITPATLGAVKSDLERLPDSGARRLWLEAVSITESISNPNAGGVSN